MGVTLTNNGAISGVGTLIIDGRIAVNLNSIQVSQHTHDWEAAWSRSVTHYWHVRPTCPLADSLKGDRTLPWRLGGDQEAIFDAAGQRYRMCAVCVYIVETEAIPASGGSGDFGSSGSSSNSSSFGNCGGGSSAAPFYAPVVRQPGQGGAVTVSLSNPKQGMR